MSHKKEEQEVPQEELKIVEDAAKAGEPQPEVTETTPTQEVALAAELKEMQDRHLRLMAEFDNFRRRTQKEKENLYADAAADTVKEMLPLLDNLQRALGAPCTDEEYRKGVQMTYNGFLETLTKLGLVEFAEVGETFDPTLHNAVMHIEDESKEKNIISQVFQRGYKLGERVLRYAMVQTAN